MVYFQINITIFITFVNCININFGRILNKIFIAQTSDKERRRRSQIIINNNKTKKDFIFNAKKALKGLIK